MKRILMLTIGAVLMASAPAVCNAQVDTKWKIHDPDRPLPPVIEPGTASTLDAPGRPPSDAVALFDGKDLSKWAHKDGKLLRPARVTVLHNGVLVQDNVEPSGPTAHGARPPYAPQPEKLPLALQDHSNPIRFRNIWIRELKAPD